VGLITANFAWLEWKLPQAFEEPSYLAGLIPLGLIAVNADILAPDADQPSVLVAVEGALRSAFSFEARSFGQDVALSEVMATIQAVPGVTAVDIGQFFRTDNPNGGGLSAVLAAAALAGITLCQLVHPGCPVVLGSFLSNIDMQSGSPGFGGPEGRQPLDRRLEGGDQLTGRRVLGDIPIRAGAEDRADHFGCPLDAERDDGKRAGNLADAGNGLWSGGIGQPEVKQHHVGLAFGNEVDGLGAGRTGVSAGARRRPSSRGGCDGCGRVSREVTTVSRRNRESRCRLAHLVESGLGFP